MKLILKILLFSLVCQTGVLAQGKTYTLSKKDWIYTGVGVGLNVLGYAMPKEGPTLTDLNSLSGNNIWGFDRSAIYNNSGTARRMSDVLKISTLALPYLLYADDKTKSEGWAIGVMAFETFLITNGLTATTKSIVERYRPFAYDPNVPTENKLQATARLSFFSGHTSSCAAMSFFAAKVITDIHPDLKHKWLIWTISATAPAVMGYLRYEGGRHFISDVVVGYGVGAVIGYMIPTVHLNENLRMGMGSQGMVNLNLTF